MTKCHSVFHSTIGFFTQLKRNLFMSDASTLKCFFMTQSRHIIFFLCFTFLLMNTQCDDDDEVQAPCGQAVVVDSGFFETAESDTFELSYARIEGNCLNVNISSSGCDGTTWSLVLVDSGHVAESLPEQRYLKLVFSNSEVCDAIVTQERSFDLTAIRVMSSNDIILNIEGLDESLHYLY